MNIEDVKKIKLPNGSGLEDRVTNLVKLFYFIILTLFKVTSSICLMVITHTHDFI